jgi:small-conductance mechanosensitive channel
MGYDLVGTIRGTTYDMGADLASFLPELLTALLVLVAGFLVGGILKSFVVRLFKTFKVNEALDAAGVDELTKRAGYPLKAGEFVGALVKWFVILVFFVAALDILGLSQVTSFFRDDVLGYLPNVIVAVLILMVAMLVAKVASETVSAAIQASGVHNPTIFRKLTYYSIITFAVMAALNQLGIAEEMVTTLFTGMVFALSLALGLAFGLGGKETAGKMLQKLTDKE